MPLEKTEQTPNNPCTHTKIVVCRKHPHNPILSLYCPKCNQILYQSTSFSFPKELFLIPVGGIGNIGTPYAVAAYSEQFTNHNHIAKQYLTEQDYEGIGITLETYVTLFLNQSKWLKYPFSSFYEWQPPADTHSKAQDGTKGPTNLPRDENGIPIQ